MMSFIAWSCRGLGNPMTIASLKDLVRHNSPSLVFLIETKCNSESMKRIQRRIGFENGVWVDPTGRAGGLAMLWKKDIDVKLRSMGSRYIDISIRQTTREHWCFTGIYGWSENGSKYKTWDLIDTFGKESDMAWLLCGDFNEVLYAYEKRGGNPCAFVFVKGFRDVLDSQSQRCLFQGTPFLLV